MHKPESVLENETHKLLGDFEIKKNLQILKIILNQQEENDFFFKWIK